MNLSQFPKCLPLTMINREREREREMNGGVYVETNWNKKGRGKKKIRNAEREKQDRGEKDRALKGKRQEVRLVQSCIHQNLKFRC